MALRKMLVLCACFVLVFSAVPGLTQSFPESQNDPVLEKIIELGKNDNQVMKWLDIVTNRFGGRYPGSDAYNNAARWAVYQFHKCPHSNKKSLWGCVSGFAAGNINQTKPWPKNLKPLKINK